VCVVAAAAAADQSRVASFRFGLVQVGEKFLGSTSGRGRVASLVRGKNRDLGSVQGVFGWVCARAVSRVEKCRCLP
jgi:hypothetical protein